MLSLKKMFSGVQTLLSKMNRAKTQGTKDKYYQEIKEKLDTQNINRVFKEDLLHQEKEQKERAKKERILQKNLEKSINRQKKLEKERARQDAKLKKMSEQQTLSARLLSDEERNQLLRRKYTQALNED